jgi:hypothetical protein
MYLRLGQRPYAPRNFWSEESGYLIPNVSIPPDNAAARAAGRSPEFGVPFDWTAGDAYRSLPEDIRRHLDGFGTVRAADIQGEAAYWGEVQNGLAQMPATARGLFDGMAPDVIRRCVEGSIVLDCHRDDHIIKRDGTARNMYLALSGTFDARNGDDVIGRLGAGEIFGESGFLLRRPRTADVYVASATGRVLSLSERSLRSVVDGDVAGGQSLLANLVAILAERLAAIHGLSG